MASELRVNTLKDASGNNSVGMSYVAEGTAKSWVNFNGTGTIATRDSFNVASLTDNGTGSYNANFTNSMNDSNYASVISGGNYHNAANFSSTSSYPLVHFGSSHTAADASISIGSVFGDLA